MKELGGYDPDDGGMFIEPVKESDMNHLRYLRFKAERGDFGYKPLSVPKGPNIFRLRQNELLGYAMKQGDQELPGDQKMRQIQAPRTQFEQQH